LFNIGVPPVLLLLPPFAPGGASVTYLGEGFMYWINGNPVPYSEAREALRRAREGIAPQQQDRAPLVIAAGIWLGYIIAQALTC
jgi:hypothetical protein